MKLLIFLISCIFSLTTFAEGGWGQYIVKGKVYKSDSTLIINSIIYFTIQGKIIEAKSDNNGEYEIKITWLTWDYDGGPPQDSLGNYIDPIIMGNKMNPSIFAECNGLTYEIKNFWKEESEKPEKDRLKSTRKIDLLFH